MSELTLSSPVYFYGANSGASAYVGYEGGKYARAVRYSFTPQRSGRFDIVLTVTQVEKNSGFTYVEIDKSLYAQIGTEENQFAGVAGETDGCVIPTISVPESGYGSITATLRVSLDAGQTYYLWLYPRTTSFGTFAFSNSVASATAEGLGVISLPTADGVKDFQPVVYTGGVWKMFAPNVHLSAEWKQMGGKE